METIDTVYALLGEHIKLLNRTLKDEVEAKQVAISINNRLAAESKADNEYMSKLAIELRFAKQALEESRTECRHRDAECQELALRNKALEQQVIGLEYERDATQKQVEELRSLIPEPKHDMMYDLGDH